jgi:hypothetical protein
MRKKKKNLKNNIHIENKDKKERKKWYQLPIIAILGLMIAIYSNSNSNIIVSNAPLQPETNIETTSDGIVVIITMTQTFTNKWFKTGFVSDAMVLPVHIDPSEYKAELIYIDKRKILPFSSNKIKFKTRVTFKNLEVILKAKSVLVFFYDNLGREIAIKGNKNANFRIEFNKDFSVN